MKEEKTQEFIPPNIGEIYEITRSDFYGFNINEPYDPISFNKNDHVLILSFEEYFQNRYMCKMYNITENISFEKTFLREGVEAYLKKVC